MIRGSDSLAAAKGSFAALSFALVFASTGAELRGPGISAHQPPPMAMKSRSRGQSARLG
jgi:hypothetical protein